MASELVRVIYGDHVEGKRILAIEADLAHPDIPESASFWHIKFYIEGYCMVLAANDDTDEIVLTVVPFSGSPPTTELLHPILKNMIGREFGWAWWGRNVQGYEDMFLLAFGRVVPDALDPQFMFLVEASSINMRKIAIA